MKFLLASRYIFIQEREREGNVQGMLSQGITPRMVMVQQAMRAIFSRTHWSGSNENSSSPSITISTFSGQPADAGDFWSLTKSFAIDPLPFDLPLVLVASISLLAPTIFIHQFKFNHHTTTTNNNNNLQYEVVFFLTWVLCLSWWAEKEICCGELGIYYIGRVGVIFVTLVQKKIEKKKKKRERW